MKPNVSILWDIENVTPSSDVFFTDGLLDLARKEGNISTATAIGNWRKNLSNALALNLSENGFELIHVPQPEKRGKAKKNSSDFALITKATEMVFQYPHIETYIMLTGDIDFRALLQMLKKHGKRIVIVCDVNTVAENLLEIADEYLDFRNLLPDPEVDDTQENTPPKNITKKTAYSLLSETVQDLVKKDKIANPGGVKVRMKLLNNNFSGKIEGYTSWKTFINDAVKDEIIVRQDTDKGVVLALPNKKKVIIPTVFKKLLTVIQELQSELDTEDISLARIGNRLSKKGIKINAYNYSQLQKLILDAEKRELIKTTNKKGFLFVKKKILK